MKKLLLTMPFVLCVLLNCRAQLDTSCQLLWYKGKKFQPGILITPASDTVKYNSKTGKLVVTCKKGSKRWLDKVKTELKQTSQRINDVVMNKCAGMPKTILPLFSWNVKSAYDMVENDFTGILSDSFSFPGIPLPAKRQVQHAGPYSRQDDISEAFDIAINELVNYVKAHEDEDVTDVPEPPVYDFHYCSGCSADREKNYHNALVQFGNELGGEDKLIMQKCFGISRQAAFLVAGGNVEQRLKKVREYYVAKMIKKVRLLFSRYGNDPSRVRAILWISLGLDRYIQLVGDNRDDPFETPVQHMLTVTAANIMKAFKEEDYPFALNAGFIFGTDRQIQLLGSETPFNLAEAFATFNQFKLSVNLSAKSGGDGSYLLGQLDGDNWFTALPDSTCHLRWMLTGPVKSRLSASLISADMRGEGGQVKYAGTKNWEGNVPRIKVDFCSNGQDTVEVYPFHAKNYEEVWQFPPPAGTMNIVQLNNVFEGCFIDMARLQQEVATFKNPANVDKLKQQMLDKYRQVLNSQAFKNVSAGKLVNIQDVLGMTAAQKHTGELADIMGAAVPGKYIFTPVVGNKSSVVFKERLNGKEIFPENTATIYAWFNLTMTHDPNGPYSIKL
ncbi:MAG TPA: hypothetical protein VG738_22100 [Chitinophagaceae bacterium]|nr:hypothetical protein [Chitinophagaceae bacterium]